MKISPISSLALVSSIAPVASAFTPSKPIKSAVGRGEDQSTSLQYQDDSSHIVEGSYLLKKRQQKTKSPASQDEKYRNDPKLGNLGKSLLAGSDLIYAFAKLRQAVIENESLPDDEKVKLQHTEYILTQNRASLLREKEDLQQQLQDCNDKPKALLDEAEVDLKHHIEDKIDEVDMMLEHDISQHTTIEQKKPSPDHLHRYLKYEVDGEMLEKFIRSNKKFVDNTLDHDVLEILRKVEGKDIGVREFDDQFNDQQLVYGITVNRTDKRLTVFFRGSVQGNRDWPTNFKALPKTLNVPPALQEEEADGSDIELDEEIKVHRGFYAYLNQKLYTTTGRRLRPFDRAIEMIKPGTHTRTKFQDIENNLKVLLQKKEFQGYRVYISGHSLGGALSQLLAYQLASRGTLQEFDNAAPVTAVTWASPMVGNEGFRQAFEQLEDKDLVRHIRVSNAGDLVPVLPPVFGYTQTGINMHVKGNGEDMEVGYQCDHEDFKSQFQYALKNKSSIKGLVNDFNKYHTIEDYKQNLFGSSVFNDEYFDKTIEELYEQFAQPQN